MSRSFSWCFIHIATSMNLFGAREAHFYSKCMYRQFNVNFKLFVISKELHNCPGY